MHSMYSCDAHFALREGAMSAQHATRNDADSHPSILCTHDFDELRNSFCVWAP